MTRAEAVVARARACLGVPFRAQGRDRRFGLDCAGLAAHAFEAAAPVGYALRGGGAQLAAGIAAAGLDAIDPGVAQAGDLLAVEAGPAQRHLAVLTGGGFIHAHAGLRRVVETPGAVPWPVLGAWRAREET